MPLISFSSVPPFLQPQLQRRPRGQCDRTRIDASRPTVGIDGEGARMIELAGRLHWSDAEFDRMAWHDVAIHGIAAVPDRFELCLDIDYIFEWLCPVPAGGAVRFRIAPATLVFEHVSSVTVALDSGQGVVTIGDVRRTKNERLPGSQVDSWHWQLDCHEGLIAFDATGFQLFVRQEPVIRDVQCLGIEDRGLPSFERGFKSRVR
jgi:hypothetical protein